MENYKASFQLLTQRDDNYEFDFKNVCVEPVGQLDGIVNWVAGHEGQKLNMKSGPEKHLGMSANTYHGC